MQYIHQFRMNCDVCGTWLKHSTEWVKLPACADSVCGKVGLCCYNVVCRDGCQFKCCNCGKLVREDQVILSNDYFYCNSCQKTLGVSSSISVTELYPYIGISVQEYIQQLMEWNGMILLIGSTFTFINFMIVNFLLQKKDGLNDPWDFATVPNQYQSVKTNIGDKKSNCCIYSDFDKTIRMFLMAIMIIKSTTSITKEPKT